MCIPKKQYSLTETGRAEVADINICPICGEGFSMNLNDWDYVSDVWNKSPLTCRHGFYITENSNHGDDASDDDWHFSVCIHRQYIPELEALGYVKK